MKVDVFYRYFKNKKEISDTWCDLLDVTIYDPDGWDRSCVDNFMKDWNKKISIYDFMLKSTHSTVSGDVFYYKILEVVSSEIKNKDVKKLTK